MLQGKGNGAFITECIEKINSNLVIPNVTAGRPGLWSEKITLHLKVPFTKCKTFADRSSIVYGPKTLPDDIRAAADIGTFRRKFKTWMFHRF